MKKLFIYLVMLLSINTARSQDDALPIGYKLKKSTQIIRIYQDKNGKPDLSRFNQWIYNYWFKRDGEPIKINDIEYVRITIPTSMKWDNSKKIYKNAHYDNPVPWKQDGIPIDSDDFNSWLWIASADLNNAVPYYGRLNRQFVFSGLTVPFRYRPKPKESSSTMLTGDLNVGTFLGMRLSSQNKAGLSFGFSGGLSSITQNSANNSFITNNTAQSISGFNYGFALVFDWQKKFQVGAVWGYDHGVGDLSKTYLYQDKKWFALSLNYQFLDFGKSKGLEQSGTTKVKN